MRPISGDTKFQVPDHVLQRRVGDETVLLSVKSEEYYATRDVGSRFFDLAGSGENFACIIATLLSEYEVDHAVLTNDLENLVSNLVDLDLISIAPAL